jgi:hypothetical protein
LEVNGEVVGEADENEAELKLDELEAVQEVSSSGEVHI